MYFGVHQTLEQLSRQDTPTPTAKSILWYRYGLPAEGLVENLPISNLGTQVGLQNNQPRENEKEIWKMKSI
jgi:hypothetical protein